MSAPIDEIPEEEIRTAYEVSPNLVIDTIQDEEILDLIKTIPDCDGLIAFVTRLNTLGNYDEADVIRNLKMFEAYVYKWRIRNSEEWHNQSKKFISIENFVRNQLTRGRTALNLKLLSTRIVATTPAEIEKTKRPGLLSRIFKRGGK